MNKNKWKLENINKICFIFTRFITRPKRSQLNNEMLPNNRTRAHWPQPASARSALWSDWSFPQILVLICPGFNFLNTTVNHCLVCSLFRLSPSTCMLTVDRSKLKLIIFIELSSPAWTARKKGMKKSYSCRTTRYSFTSHIFYLLLCVCEREGVVYHCFSYLSYCLKLELPEINR